MAEPLDQLTIERIAITQRMHRIPRATPVPPAPPDPPDPPPHKTRECKGCGVSFVPARGWQKYCTAECCEETDNKRRREQRAAATAPLDKVSVVKAIVATVWEIPIDELSNASHARKWSWPRQAAMVLCRQYAIKNSRPSVARLFGGKDHTTQIHAHAAVERRLSVSRPEFAEFSEKYRAAEAKVRAALEKAA